MPAPVDQLTRELELVREFIAHLNSEQEALKRGRTDDLAVLGQKKSELADQLNAIEKERNAFLQRAGHTWDREGMAAWLAAHPADRVAAGLWAKLLEGASEAKRLNELNGRLVAIRLQVTNQALGILTQQSQRSTLYGRDGMTTPKTGSRIIDAA